MTSDLINLGIKNDKSFTCEMPKIPEKHIWDFIRGIFDGDGCVTGKNGRLSISIIGSSKIIFKIKEIFKSNKLSDTKLNVISENNGNVIYSIKQNSYNDILFFRNKIYQNNPKFKLNRKFKKLMTLDTTLSEIRCTNKKNGETKIFKNAREFSKYSGISESMINMVISGKRKSRLYKISKSSKEKIKKDI